MKKNYLSMLIIYLLHIPLLIVGNELEGTVFNPIPFPIYALITLPFPTALAGIVDMIIALKQQDLCCRLFSVASGILSVLIMIIAWDVDIVFPSVDPLLLVIVFAVLIWILWIIRGILFHRQHRDNA